MQKLLAVTNYLKAKPEMWAYDSADTMQVALSDAFPCVKKAIKKR